MTAPKFLFEKGKTMSKKSVRAAFSVTALGAIGVFVCAGMAAAEEKSFEISLAGAAGSGDPDGTGKGTVTIDSATNQVGWEISYSNIAEPTAMHIHQGAAGQSGGVVEQFTVEKDTDGNLVGLTDASAETVQAILASPAGYYVNIHNAEHRGGAIRGQLAN
jgi:hypothetical protein